MDYQKLFNHMVEKHELILIETEMQEIIDIVSEIIYEHTSCGGIVAKKEGDITILP